MASSHQKGNGHSRFINKSPHFFKIILPETLRDGKLEIPKMFIRKYGNGMSSPTLLRVPSDEIWKVELRKCDGKVWLKNGWQEFANHYSLEHGHFLVFRYEGNCNFHVVIFNRTASEIEYPYTGNYHKQFKERPEDSEREDDDSTQIIEDIPPRTKNREKFNLHCRRPQKKMRSTDSANITESNLKSKCMTPQAMHTGCPTISGDKKALALQRAARAYKSENPFFVLVMQPSYVTFSNGFGLAIPTGFARKHLMKADCEIILCNSNGNTWPVSFHQRRKGKNRHAVLFTGWSTFVQDNNIQVGDVCAFELINCVEISFKVVKHQAGKFHDLSASSDAVGPVKEKARASSPTPSQCWGKPLNALQKAKALQLASAFRSENPSFTVVLQPSYVHTSKLSVPEDFARRYFKKMHHEVVLYLSDDGKSWPLKFNQYSMGRKAKFFSGWRAFVLDNNLEVGNVCVFELNEGTETSFKVTIYRQQAFEDAKLASWL